MLTELKPDYIKYSAHELIGASENVINRNFQFGIPALNLGVCKKKKKKGGPLSGVIRMKWCYLAAIHPHPLK